MRGVTGYCATAYLSFESDTAGNEKPVASVAIVLPSSGLNLRAAADENAGVIMTLPQGTMLTVTGEVRDNGMLPVLLGTLAGYVKSDYVYVTDQALATATPAPTQTPCADGRADGNHAAERQYARCDCNGGRRVEAPRTAEYGFPVADDDALRNDGCGQRRGGVWILCRELWRIDRLCERTIPAV